MLENKKITDVFADLLAETLRDLYGSPTQIVGNLMGIAYKGGGSGASMTFMDELNRYDGKQDYLGIENANLIRLEAIVGNVIAEAVETPQLYTAPTPFSDKPIPK